MPFVEGKKISFPAQTHSEPSPPLKDGFTEVIMTHSWLHPAVGTLFGCHLGPRTCVHLLRWSHFGYQVHLSAVVPTVPVAASSFASTGLEQSFTGLSVSSNPPTVLTSLQTGKLHYLLKYPVCISVRFAWWKCSLQTLKLHLTKKNKRTWVKQYKQKETKTQKT